MASNVSSSTATPVTGARIRAQCQTSRRAAKVVDQEVDPDEIPSPLECQAIARAIPARFGTLVRVLYALGLRLGEATDRGATSTSHPSSSP